MKKCILKTLLTIAICFVIEDTLGTGLEPVRLFVKTRFDIQSGQRVGIAFTNSTNMGHPLHLHGHDSQVVEVDGEKVPGALGDTLMVPPGSKMTVAFDADNAGVWSMHCHLLYHLDTGMFTVVRYDGTDAKFWRPKAQAKELGIPSE